MNNLGKTLVDSLNRMTLIQTHYEVLTTNLLELFANPEIHKYINHQSLNQIFKYFVDNAEIWTGVKGALFKIINMSGKVSNKQIGGGGNGHLLYWLLILLMMASFNFSQLVDTKKRYDVTSLHESIENKLFTNNAGLSVVVPDAIQHTFFGLTIPNSIALDYSKMFSTFSKDTSTLVGRLRKHCGDAALRDPGRRHAEFTSQMDGKVSATIIQGETLVTPVIACHSIPSKLFEFNTQTGEIAYFRSEFTFGEIKTIISETATNMDNVINTDRMTGDSTSSDLKNAYNKIVLILNTLDEVDKLMHLQGIPEIVSDNSILASDRESALKEYLDSIVEILKYGAEISGKTDVSTYIQTMDAVKKADEQKELAEMRSGIRQVERDARQIDSDATREDRVASVKNAYGEIVDPLSTFGTSLLNTTVSATEKMVDAAGDVIFSPFAFVDKGLKRLRHLIVDNGFILFIALLGAAVTGIISIKIVKTGTIKIRTTIKEIILSPITIPFRIGKRIYNKIFYRLDKETLITEIEDAQAPLAVQQVLLPPAPALQSQEIDMGAVRARLLKKKQLTDRIKKLEDQIINVGPLDNNERVMRVKLLNSTIENIKKELGTLNASGITRRVKRNKKYPTKNKKYGKLRKLTKHKKRGTKRK